MDRIEVGRHSLRPVLDVQLSVRLAFDVQRMVQRVDIPDLLRTPRTRGDTPGRRRRNAAPGAAGVGPRPLSVGGRLAEGRCRRRRNRQRRGAHHRQRGRSRRPPHRPDSALVHRAHHAHELRRAVLRAAVRRGGDAVGSGAERRLPGGFAEDRDRLHARPVHLRRLHVQLRGERGL